MKSIAFKILRFHIYENEYVIEATLQEETDQLADFGYEIVDVRYDGITFSRYEPLVEYSIIYRKEKLSL